MKRLPTFIAASLVAVAMTGAETPKPAPTSSDPVVITYGTTQVRQSEFEQALKSLPADYQSYARGAGKRTFAEDYVQMKIMAAQAEQAGLDKDPLVAAQLRLLRENALANAQLAKVEETLKPSDADLQKTYEQHKAELDQVHARHILIAFAGSKVAQEGKPKLTDEQAKAKAEDLRKKIVAGADFAELAKKESDDIGSGSRGGDLGTFAKGQMVPEFEKAAFETPVGKVSDVVHTEFGYHIIKVEEHKTLSMADIRPQLEKEVKKKMIEDRMNQMKQTAKVSFDEKFFAAPPMPSMSQEAAPEQPSATPAPKPAAKATSKPKKK